MTNLKDAATDLLFSAILSLRTIDECYAFFEDICTIAELKSLTQRLHVAMMLQQGRTYTEICDETGVSTATISRVNRSLEYGADGYKTVLDRLAAAGCIRMTIRRTAGCINRQIVSWSGRRPACGHKKGLTASSMGLIEKIFGTHSDREIKRLIPLVSQVESLADFICRRCRNTS